MQPGLFPALPESTAVIAPWWNRGAVRHNDELAESSPAISHMSQGWGAAGLGDAAQLRFTG